MTDTAADRQRRASDPTLADFYNDMNQHGNATYKRVPPAFVVELERHLAIGGSRSSGSAWLTVWQAVKDGGRYAPPDGDRYAPPDGKEGNRYAWDAVGRQEFDDLDDARAEFVRLGKSKAKVRAFCEANPYEGPRSPYSERHDEGDE